MTFEEQIKKLQLNFITEKAILGHNLHYNLDKQKVKNVILENQVKLRILIYKEKINTDIYYAQITILNILYDNLFGDKK